MRVSEDPLFCSEPSSHPSLLWPYKVTKALVDASTSISVVQYHADRDMYTLAAGMFSHPPPPPGHHHRLDIFYLDSSANFTTKYDIFVQCKNC
ncbi:hypothetical protein Pcinc_018217 [Petrolisthes cinctipes]|uniref:Uncharacterized protein n=1 Tax=Petrolisthes cinctipes TaxID=88211 RepID=A0AAE1FSJ9_PETCI|nr:hypothetical protein Pcinc_018217 [Petrolisthes cinctipes]